MHEVKIFPCVISRMGRPSPITQSHLDSMLMEVNTIFQQVGIHFTYGAPILNIINDGWAQNGLININVANQIRSKMSGTGGLEVYFIPGELSGTGRMRRKMGTWAPSGIILRNSADARTFAHEIGHACGLYDIYIDHDDVVPSFLLENVKREWMSDDWNNGTGCRFYNPLLRQRDLIQRLLMFGNANGSKSDMPRGFVWGLLGDGESGNVCVGRSWMTLSPRSW